MVFKVQDGIEFETKAEWRKYMVETYYSVKNKTDEKYPIVKHPGTINGQSFDIADCTGCRIVIMDNCEQVQVDNVQNCQIFIGASASTVFIRNCEDCTIYSCSRQLRLRECFNSAFYVFSMSEVHIEMSKDVVFAPFAGGYKEHAQSLAAANLDTSTNYWNQLYDHSDTDKVEDNWHILPEHDRNSPWFPDGSNSSCFGDVNDSAIPSGTASGGQVGESYGMDQMLRDHQAATLLEKRSAVEESNPRIRERSNIDFEGLPMKSVGDGVKQLGIEVALLIAAATAKGIDVSIWLTDLPGISVIPAAEFNTKLTSLGLAVGIHESWEAKRELDLATSKSSLKTIFSLCGHISSESGTPMIDVSLFLRLSLERVEEHLRHIQLGVDAPPSPVKRTVQPPPMLKPTPPVSPRPAALRSPIPTREPEVPSATKAPAPVDSPPEPPATMNEYRYRSMDFNESGRGRRSRSADGRASANVFVGTAPRESRSREPLRASDRFRLSGLSSDEFESFIKGTVQKTDLYHLIQVHLGYVKPYSIIPPRGDVVVSTPRAWFSVRDLQRAFMAARLRLTDFHVHSLMQLVCDFAQKVRKITVGRSSTVSDISTGRDGEAPSEENEADNLQSETPQHLPEMMDRPVTKNGKLSAEWFRSYMVHLRLHRPSIPWLEWLGGKLKQDEISQDDKPKDFRRALAGKAYALSKEEINELLMKFELIPEDALLAEIQRRVDTYVMDIHGRMDFQHQLNIKLRHWKKTNPGAHSSSEVAAMGEKFTQELRKERYQELLTRERTEAAITKELFWTFDLACRESKYTLRTNFGEWLVEHARKAVKHIETVKDDFSERIRSTSLRASRKHSFAPLNRLVDCLSTVARMLPQAPQLEFRKAIISLKREAESKRIAHGKVVSKLMFDKHFENLLLGPYQSYLQQDPTLKDLTTEARKSHEWRKSNETDDVDVSESNKDFWTKTKFNEIFSCDISEALQASKDFEDQKASEAEDNFARWMEGKLEAKKRSKQQEEEKAREKKEKEDAAKKAAKVSYRRWLKLRKKEMYFSKGERKKKGLPKAVPLHHDETWKKELDTKFERPELLDYDA